MTADPVVMAEMLQLAADIAADFTTTRTGLDDLPASPVLPSERTREDHR